MRPLLALGALGALVAAAAPGPASALEAPTPLARDKRVRVVAYDPDEVVQVYAAPGSTVRIQVSPDETVSSLLVSDQAIMSGEIEADAGVGVGVSDEPGVRQAGQPNLACDTNLCRSVVGGSFVFLKPVRELEPQPLHLITKRCIDAANGAQKCHHRAYQFEVLTRSGSLAEATPNTFFVVRFDYPADRAAAAQAKAEADAARRRASARAASINRRAAAERRALEAEERLAAETLRARQGAALNSDYGVKGDRAVLGAAR